MIGAAMGSFARDTRAVDVGPHAGLVAPMERVCGVGGNGLPGGMGMAGLLEGNDGSVIVSAKSGDCGPVGLEARNVEANQVYGVAWAVPVRRAGVSTSAAVAERPEARKGVTQFEQHVESAGWLGRG